MTVLYDHDDVRLVADDRTLHISGAPDFDNATSLAAAGVKWIGEHDTDGASIGFDASDVERISSAMLTVLLEWIRAARRHNLTVCSITLSRGLREIVALADLNEIFPA